MPTRPPRARSASRNYPGADNRRGFSWRFRRALGIRRSFKIDGIRYREVTTEPLRAALSKRGRGFKEFDVLFRTGPRLRIRCTRERIFADLVPPPTLPVFLRIERSLRPGMRTLVVPCGTGFGAAMVAGRISPSGAVVALDEDTQAIEYARHRYTIQDVAFECGGMRDLGGETDGAFNAVISIEATRKSADEARIAELWRLVAPDGWLLMAHATPSEREQSGDEARQANERLVEALSRVCIGSDASEQASHSRATIGSMGDGRDGWTVAIARRGVPE